MNYDLTNDGTQSIVFLQMMSEYDSDVTNDDTLNSQVTNHVTVNCEIPTFPVFCDISYGDSVR